MAEQELATFAGGCFWCLEAAYDELRGVHNVDSGYTGGETTNPSYEQVCSGRTGHAEAVQVSYDPDAVSYRDLVEVFFTVHDPTQLNRQGADVGTQYRSAIFTHSPEQEKVAREVMADLERDDVFGAPIVTTIEPLRAFYPAEKFHRDYYARNEGQPYCQAVISPKLSKLRKMHGDKLRSAL
ncbi:MAG TPA: peptide-methionine (S)-S-oxide reductase MsrA [Longimicrobiales bacterium]